MPSFFILKDPPQWIMGDDEKLNARYSRLVSPPAAPGGIQRGAKGDEHATKDLQERLSALSGGRDPGGERDYEERLSRLLSRGVENPTVDDLEVRFARLGGASNGTTRSPTFDVPPVTRFPWTLCFIRQIHVLVQPPRSFMELSIHHFPRRLRFAIDTSA